MIIRKMEIDDIDFVYNEEKRIFGTSLGKEMLYNEVNRNPLANHFIAIENGVRVGYVSSWIDVQRAEILNLFVTKKYRNKGIGKSLVNQVIKICVQKEVTHLSLEVRTSNKSAINLYRSLGFRKVLVREKYYQDGEDAILMVRKIGELDASIKR